jgi:hypothetical protein
VWPQVSAEVRLAGLKELQATTTIRSKAMVSFVDLKKEGLKYKVVNRNGVEWHQLAATGYQRIPAKPVHGESKLRCSGFDYTFGNMEAYKENVNPEDAKIGR